MSEETLLLRFVRHGSTDANEAGLRCGGDLDLPMSELGHRQAEQIAERVARLHPPVELIVTSDLRRTRQTAAAIARRLPDVQIMVEPGFAERRLGRWNLLPIRESQPWLESRRTPPDGESDGEFAHRIARAVQTLAPELPRRPLLVASKGVARVLGQFAGRRARIEPENGDVLEFDLSPRVCGETVGSLS